MMSLKQARRSMARAERITAHVVPYHLCPVCARKTACLRAAERVAAFRLVKFLARWVRQARAQRRKPLSGREFLRIAPVLSRETFDALMEARAEDA